MGREAMVMKNRTLYLFQITDVKCVIILFNLRGVVVHTVTLPWLLTGQWDIHDDCLFLLDEGRGFYLYPLATMTRKRMK
jgi:hypothetical protein